MASSESGDARGSDGPTSPEECLECLRRKWLCDATRPVCNRCRAAGIVCPGYGDAKPLVWLAPGTATSHSRRRKNAPVNNSARASSLSFVPVKVPVRVKTEPAERPMQSFTFLNADQMNMKQQASTPKRKTTVEKGKDTSRTEMEIQKQSDVDAIVKREMSPSIRPPVLGSRPTELNREWFDMMTTSEYHNRYIYTELCANRLAPTPFIGPLILARRRIASTHHGILSLVIQHELMLGTPNSKALIPLPGEPTPTTGEGGKLWRRVHYHTGAAIRALQEALTNKDSQLSDVTFSSVVLILIVQLHQSVLPNWKPHVAGILAMIEMKGGFGELLASNSAGLKLVLLNLIIVSVIANTTCAAAEQLAAEEHFKQIDKIETVYAMAIYPHLPCPGVLFREIIFINRLRHRLATDCGPSSRLEPDTVTALLSRIAAVDTKAWATEKKLDSRPECLQVARIFRATVLLYAMNALAWPTDTQPPSPPDGHHFPTRQECREELLNLLEDNFESPVILRCILWPLIVAGVEAANGAATERKFVAACLMDLSDRIGVPALTARVVLERIWASGATEWDKCFSEPYMILV